MDEAASSKMRPVAARSTAGAADPSVAAVTAASSSVEPESGAAARARKASDAQAAARASSNQAPGLWQL